MAEDPPDPPAMAERSPGRAEALLRTPRAPLFLQRETYRRRRVMDAARLLPFLGVALLFLPMLWADSHTTAMGAVYLFLAWLALIVLAAFMASKLSGPLRGQRAASVGKEPPP